MGGGLVRPSFILEWDGRLVTQAPSLEERDPVHLTLWLGSYRHYTSPTFPLTLNLVLGVHCHDGPLFQIHFLEDVKTD